MHPIDILLIIHRYKSMHPGMVQTTRLILVDVTEYSE